MYSRLKLGSLFYISWMLKRWTSPVPEMSESHESPLKLNVLHTFAGNFREFMGTHAGTSGLSGSKFHSKSPFCSKFSFSPALKFVDCLILNLCMPLILSICTYLDQCDWWLFVHTVTILSSMYFICFVSH